MNALGDDIVSLITQTLKPASEQVANFEAFIITGDSANFSVGANLMQLLLAIQDEEWDEVDLAVRAFQNMTQAIKFCPRPVVVAPYGMCLGGGTEISLHAAARQPHAELYMGLVETGVGLIPGGGGCKEMLLRSIEAGSSIRPDARGEGVEIFEALKKNFETIAKATVSTSAAEARSLGFLRPSDAITMNRDRLITDAKHKARDLADSGYSAPIPRTDIPAPGESVLATLKLAVWTMREGQYISAHDAKVANWVAYALCGGKVTPGTPRQRTIPPRPRTRSLPLPLRRKENPGTHRLHPKNRQAAEELETRCQPLNVRISTGAKRSGRPLYFAFAIVRGHSMNEVVITSAVRTAIGKAPRGTLRTTRPDDLAAIAITGALARIPQLDRAEIEDVILGCAMPEAEQGMNVARVASFRAGLPITPPP